MNRKGVSVERGFPATATKPGRGPAIHKAGNGMRANGPTHKQVGNNSAEKLDANAQLNYSQGKTALDLARENGHEACVLGLA
jgi:hypothetical protein